jgi:tetratricopeptide (TPR) repeat protein
MRNLFVVFSIGAELRARAYTEGGRQDDYLDCQAFGDVCEFGLDAEVHALGLPPVQTLYRYYLTVLPFLSHTWLSALGAPNTSLDHMRDEDFYSDLPKYRALITMGLRQHKKAKIELQKHLMAYPEDLECLTSLGNVLKIFQKFQEAFLCHYRALYYLLCSGDYVCNGKQLRSLDQIISWREFVQPLKSSMNTTLAFHCLRVHLYNLGICYRNMQQYLKSADCLECCVELYREGLGTLEDVHGLARTLNVLACIYKNDGSDADIGCLQEALDIYANSGSFVTSSAEATTKFNLASRYHSRGQFHRAQRQSSKKLSTNTRTRMARAITPKPFVQSSSLVKYTFAYNVTTKPLKF